jgi:hypothetical protein
MRPYEFRQPVMPLKPTGDYLPFLALVNRFIERPFEFSKRFLQALGNSNLQRTGYNLPYGVAALSGMGTVRGVLHRSPVLDSYPPEYRFLAQTQAAGATGLQGSTAAMGQHVGGDGRSHVALALCFHIPEPDGLDARSAVVVRGRVSLFQGEAGLLAIAVHGAA